jgi:hypothetical protein
MTVAISILGVRETNGRFASMANAGVREIAFERAGLMARNAEAEFSREAPRSGLAEHGKSSLAELNGTRPFHQSFHGVAMPTGRGFTVSVSTSQPVLAGWLRDGTPAHEIRPKSGNKMLHWQGGEGGVWARVVHHPGTRANPWEERTRLRLQGEMAVEGGRIGARIGSGLGGRL